MPLATWLAQLTNYTGQSAWWAAGTIRYIHWLPTTEEPTRGGSKRTNLVACCAIKIARPGYCWRAKNRSIYLLTRWDKVVTGAHVVRLTKLPNGRLSTRW